MSTEQPTSKIAQALLTLCLVLGATTVYLWHNRVVERKEMDLIENHPNNLAVVIMKTIYDKMDPMFRLDQIDKNWYLNDPYEILSTEMDLFYVPKYV
jgi:hypothetical protein